MDETLTIIVDADKTRVMTFTYLMRYVAWPRRLVVVDCRAGGEPERIPPGLAVALRNVEPAFRDHPRAFSSGPAVAVVAVTGGDVGRRWC